MTKRTLAKEHEYPYNYSRWHATDDIAEWDSWQEYRAAFVGVDDRANAVLRWDLEPAGVDYRGEEQPDRLYLLLAKVNKGHLIRHVVDLSDATAEDYRQIEAYLRGQWDVMREAWLPVSKR